MTKSRMLVFALTLTLGLSTLTASPPSSPINTAPPPASLADVEGGRPWGAILACGGCVGGAISLFLTGGGAIFAALANPRGAMAAGMCIAACTAAFA